MGIKRWIGMPNGRGTRPGPPPARRLAPSPSTGSGIVKDQRAANRRVRGDADDRVDGPAACNHLNASKRRVRALAELTTGTAAMANAHVEPPAGPPATGQRRLVVDHLGTAL